MALVAAIPPVFEKALEGFRLHFGAPAFEHFKRYVVGLIISVNLTVAGINRVHVQSKHPSSLNRFLTVGIWKEQEVNRERIQILKAKGDLRGPGLLVLDDTLSHKTGKKIEGVGILWDHSEGRYVLAHNIVVVTFINRKGKSYPLDFRLYIKKDLCQAKGIVFKTKIELGMELIEYALSLGLQIQGALFDNWFASNEFIRFLGSKGLYWVSSLKSDRNIKIRGKYVQIRYFAASLSKESFKRVQVGDQIYQTFTKAVDLKGVGKVRILISYDNEDFSGDPNYFATDQIRWEAIRIIKTYSKRWKIETFFRDSKQNLGLEDYQLRDLRGIKRHWYLIFLAYSLLEAGLVGVCQKSCNESPTLGELITNATRNVFYNLVGWIKQEINRGQSQEDICRIVYGF